MNDLPPVLGAPPQLALTTDVSVGSVAELQRNHGGMSIKRRHGNPFVLSIMRNTWRRATPCRNLTCTMLNFGDAEPYKTLVWPEPLIHCVNVIAHQRIFVGEKRGPDFLFNCFELERAHWSVPPTFRGLRVWSTSCACSTDG
jgi:hypothetical protein